MSNSGNLFRRYVWLINTVRRNRLTRPQILARWADAAENDSRLPMPEKTFHNHIDAIEEIFNLRIRCNRAAGAVYEIEGDGDNGLADWLLSTLSVSNAVRESADLRGRIIFEEIPSGEKFLMPLIEAMRDSVRVRLVYDSFRRPDHEPFVIEPYCVKVSRQRWYVLGRTAKGMRTYALDRIVSMEATGEKFELPAGFDAGEYFSDSFGIYTLENVAPQIVTVRVGEGQDRYFDSLPLHHSQTLVERGRGYSVYAYRLIPTFDFIQELLSHGDALEVLSPEPLRRLVAEKVALMNEFYSD
ncbi:MAG: WYL domain-containing protein [Bacteroidetes bacterium]|uniref:WYL domain-containing protein n=1 Tax=Candidatus Cryptobacteroides avistercoris TaxID=2840758 RepID=A0A9D9IY79_9BACT|nr:WYL domain-containing protein [Candidatus Cryptobacteroides avistercoris]